jgi:hypothetical protein
MQTLFREVHEPSTYYMRNSVTEERDLAASCMSTLVKLWPPRRAPVSNTEQRLQTVSLMGRNLFHGMEYIGADQRAENIGSFVNRVETWAPAFFATRWTSFRRASRLRSSSARTTLSISGSRMATPCRRLMKEPIGIPESSQHLH